MRAVRDCNGLVSAASQAHTRETDRQDASDSSPRGIPHLKRVAKRTVQKTNGRTEGYGMVMIYHHKHHMN